MDGLKGKLSLARDPIRELGRERNRIWVAGQVLLPQQPSLRATVDTLLRHASAGADVDQEELRALKAKLDEWYESF